MITVLFWVVTQRVVVVTYRRFGTTCRSHLQGPRNSPEERRFQDLLWSMKVTFDFPRSCLVTELRCKPEGCGFHSRWCSWNFALTLSFWLHYGPGIDSASNRNEYQKYFLGGKGDQCVGLTTLQPSGTDCLKIWGRQHPGTLMACPGL